MGLTDFSFTHFEEEADFSMSEFSIYTNFGSSYFRTTSDFSVAKFNGIVSFIGASFKAKVDFSVATFKYTASFAHAHFKKAIFIMAKFESDIDFKSAHFRKSLTLFQTEFRGNIDFSNAAFDNESPYFSIGQNTPNICVFFSYLMDPKNYIFTVSHQSRFSIATEKITVADGRTFTIPVGCMLFDPAPLPAQQPIEPAG